MNGAVRTTFESIIWLCRCRQRRLMDYVMLPRAFLLRRNRNDFSPRLTRLRSPRQAIRLLPGHFSLISRHSKKCKPTNTRFETHNPCHDAHLWRIFKAATAAWQKAILFFGDCATHINPDLNRLNSLIMRPSSLGGGRILRRTLSVCPSVRLSVRPSRASRSGASLGAT